MKYVKKAAAVGAGLTAAVLGAGALVYECALNTKINAKCVALFDKPDPEQTALYEGTVYADRQDWFSAHKGEDHVLTTPQTGRIHAYIIPAEAPSHRWAVLCHGYNSTPASTAVYARHFHSLGYHCVCPSLRGWGNDETNYCSMGYRDKDICIAWVEYILCVDPDAEIVLQGYSMGAVTVMLTTGEKLPEQVKAAVADCGFTSCWEQYANVIKVYTKLPPFPLLYAVNAASILRGNHDIRKNRPIDAVRRSVTPTIFLHGTADDFVPFAMMDRLYDACAAPKAKQAIEGGVHARAVYRDPALYWKAVDDFLKDRIE